MNYPIARPQRLKPYRASNPAPRINGLVKNAPTASLIARSVTAEEFQVLCLGMAGFTYAYIMEHSGLAHATIYRILKKRGVKVTDYRKGLNFVSRFVTKAIDQQLADRIRTKLKLLQ